MGKLPNLISPALVSSWMCLWRCWYFLTFPVAAFCKDVSVRSYLTVTSTTNPVFLLQRSGLVVHFAVVIPHMWLLKHCPILLFSFVDQHVPDVVVSFNPAVLCYCAVSDDVGARFIFSLAVSTAFDALILSSSCWEGTLLWCRHWLSAAMLLLVFREVCICISRSRNCWWYPPQSL